MEPGLRVLRHTGMKRTLASAALLSVALLTGCGEQSDDTPAAATVTPKPEPVSLTCPTTQRSVASPPFTVADAMNGFDTAEAAMDSFLATKLARTLDFGSEYVITADGESAWVLREDGTAQARVTLQRSDSGLLFEGYEACA